MSNAHHPTPINPGIGRWPQHHHHPHHHHEPRQRLAGAPPPPPPHDHDHDRHHRRDDDGVDGGGSARKILWNDDGVMRRCGHGGDDSRGRLEGRDDPGKNYAGEGTGEGEAGRHPPPRGGGVPPAWNRLNATLFVAYSLSVAAVSVPITLIPVISTDVATSSAAASSSASSSSSALYDPEYPSAEQGDYYGGFDNNNGDYNGGGGGGGESEASFATKMASSAVLGSAVGKFVHGQAGDVFGARRVLSVYSALCALSLLALSLSTRPASILLSGALVEFFQAVQWPCLLVLLSSHYGGEDNGGGVAYENGVNVVSLASRVGAIVSMPLCSLLLRHTSCSWRTLSRWGALLSLLSGGTYWYRTRDSPRRIHDPINPPPPPLHDTPMRIYRNSGNGNSPPFFVLLSHAFTTVHSIGTTIVIPSVRSTLLNGTFWTVAIGHTGGSIVRASERLLGTYFENTSDGTINRFQSGGYSVIMSFGIVAGLTSWGATFTGLAAAPHGGRRRTEMIRRLYALAVSMCVVLSFASLPAVRRAWFLPTWLAWSVEVVASFVLGASLAVPYYHIPALVAPTFGSDRGLYVSLTDGVAFGLSSFLLRVLGRVVQTGDPEGYGWAYCWLDVSVVLVACSFVMVRFVAVFFRSTSAKTAAKAPAFAPRGFGGADRGGGRDVVPPPRLPRPPPTPGSLPRDWGRPPTDPNDTGPGSVATAGEQGEVARSPSPAGRRRRRRQTPDRGGVSAEWSEPPHRTAAVEQRGRSEMRREDLLLFDTTGEEGDGHGAAISSTARDSTPSSAAAAGGEDAEEPPRQQLRDRLLRLLDLEENQVCCDCPAPLPRWASIIVAPSPPSPRRPQRQQQLGCFLCQDCASAHRRMGVHVAVVRSVDHDDWADAGQVEAMERGGNGRVNALYAAGLVGVDLPDRGRFLGGGGGRERFVVDKYQRRRWFMYEERPPSGPGGSARDVAGGESSLVDPLLCSDDDEDDSGDDAAEGAGGGGPPDRSIELVLSSVGAGADRDTNTRRDFDAVALQMPSSSVGEGEGHRISPPRDHDATNLPLVEGGVRGGRYVPQQDLLSDNAATVQRGEYDPLPDIDAAAQRSRSKADPYHTIDEAHTESLSDSSEDCVDSHDDDDDEGELEEDGLEEISFFPVDEEEPVPPGATRGQEVPYNPFSS